MRGVAVAVDGDGAAEGVEVGVVGGYSVGSGLGGAVEALVVSCMFSFGLGYRGGGGLVGGKDRRDMWKRRTGWIKVLPGTGTGGGMGKAAGEAEVSAEIATTIRRR